MGIIENLEKQGIGKKLIDDAIYFKQYYKLEENISHRISNSSNYFYGSEIMKQI